MNPEESLAKPSPEPAPAPIAHVEFKALLLLGFTALLVCTFLAYVMVARGVFERTQQLVLMADDSEGVQVGMDLTFSGFPIGRVRRIELDELGKARVLIDVPSKDAHWLRTSSIFTSEKGLVGETHLRAFSGMLTDPPLPDGAVRTVLRGDTSSEVPRLVASVRALLENLERITSTDSSLNASIGNMQTITGSLGKSMVGPYGVMGAILGGDANAKKVINALDTTNALLAKTDQRLFGAKGVMDETQASVAQLSALLQEARGSLKKVDALLAEAQGVAVEVKGVASEARGVATNARLATTDLALLRGEVDASLRKINSMVDEINRKWPFARDREIKLP
jgi:phospholipid/cholesterol/gamma-HCH transport system substrate-binding protein